MSYKGMGLNQLWDKALLENENVPSDFYEAVSLLPTSKKGREGLLGRLKDETQREHEQLENDLNLLRPDLAITSYRALLERLYGFYAPWEQTIVQTFPDQLRSFYVSREKVPKLTSDLQFLGCRPTSLPVCEDLPNLDTVSRVLGSLYVIEGATLGGQLISRHLQQRFGFTDGRGYAFFEGYGSSTGMMWREFRECFVRYSPHDEPAIRGAKDTFRCIHRWLCRIEG